MHRFRLHVVEEFGMAHAKASTRLRQQMRGIGHRLQSACQYGVDVTQANLVRALHDRLQSGPAQLVHGGSRYMHWDAAGDRRLTCRTLADARG